MCFGGRLMRGNRTRKVDSSKYQVGSFRACFVLHFVLGCAGLCWAVYC
jgi:hypothetical protein